MWESIHGLIYGFGLAFEPHNLMWCFVGVLLGNLIGVLPGTGALTSISMLLPLTFAMQTGARDTDAGRHLLRLTVWWRDRRHPAVTCHHHPPHAVTCLDGFPLTQKGKGGMALGLTMLASFFASSVGIVVMIFAAPPLGRAALQFGPAELFSIMLLGLVVGATMSRGSPVKGIAMTVIGMLLGSVGTDITTGIERFGFRYPPNWPTA